MRIDGITFDKRVSIGNLLTAIPIVIGMAVIWGQQSNRIDNMESNFKESKEQFYQIIAEARASRDRQISDLKTMTDKQVEDARNSIVQIQQASIQVSERLAKLEVRVDYMGSILAKIDSKIPDPDSVDMRRKN